jgi:FtsH-binding integral membrane protein
MNEDHSEDGLDFSAMSDDELFEIVNNGFGRYQQKEVDGAKNELKNREYNHARQNEQNSSMEKPIEVTRAVQLLYASLGIGIVKVVFDFARLSSEISLMFILFVMILTFGLLFFFIWKISDGRNWARIVFLILFLLGLPISIPIYLEEIGRNLFLATLTSIQIIIQIVAIYLMFMKKSNPWFRVRKVHVNTM